MDKYWEEDMKSYSNYSNIREINIDLPNLFCFKLCLSPSNNHINNLKGYGDFAEENKQYDRSDSQHDDTQPNHATMLESIGKKKTHLIFSSSWPY